MSTTITLGPVLAECEECGLPFHDDELIDIGYTILCEECFEEHDPPSIEKREDFHADG